MVRLAISGLLHLAANALGLVVAAAVLDRMSIDGVAFVVAVLIFTVVEILAEPLLRQMALRNVSALLGSVALVSTFIGLLVTAVVSDGLHIRGASTWLFATVIVWIAALLANLVLPLFFLKKAVEQAKS